MTRTREENAVDLALEDQPNETLVELLWDYLKRDPEHNDRRQTSWGTKTKMGLTRSIRRIIEEEQGR